MDFIRPPCRSAVDDFRVALCFHLVRLSLLGFLMPRRFQFSLRTLLILTTLCAPLFGLLGRLSYRAEKQRRAVETLWKSGATICFDEDLGILQWRNRVIEVRIANPISDSDVEALRALDGLELVDCYGMDATKLRAALPNCRIESDGAYAASE